MYKKLILKSSKISREGKNMQEQWTRWEPIAGLTKKYDIISCHDDCETGFTIVLCEEDDFNKQLHVNWKNSVDAFRQIDESFTIMLIDDLHKRYGVGFYCNWTFFKVTNSKYLQGLSELSSGVIDYLPGCMHFAFFSSELLIDVITYSEPEVTIVNLP